MIDRPRPAKKSWDGDAEIAELGDLLIIDEHALEDAARDQPEAFYRVSKRLAILISERDEAKQNVATVESEVELEVRREAAENNDKVTEGEVKARCRIDTRVTAAQREHNWFNKWVGQYSALKEAFQQRSYALNHLIELHLSSYYGEVKTSSKLRDVSADRARKSMQDDRRRRE